MVCPGVTCTTSCAAFTARSVGERVLDNLQHPPYTFLHQMFISVFREAGLDDDQGLMFSPPRRFAVPHRVQLRALLGGDPGGEPTAQEDGTRGRRGGASEGDKQGLQSYRLTSIKVDRERT